MNPEDKTVPTPEIGEADFELEVLKSKLPVLVAFLVPWSRACQVLKPVLSEVAAACVNRAKVVAVNTDDNLGLGVSYNIQSVPTLICFVAGRERVRIIGTASQAAILSKLKPFSEAPTETL